MLLGLQGGIMSTKHGGSSIRCSEGADGFMNMIPAVGGLRKQTNYSMDAVGTIQQLPRFARNPKYRGRLACGLRGYFRRSCLGTTLKSGIMLNGTQRPVGFAERSRRELLP